MSNKKSNIEKYMSEIKKYKLEIEKIKKSIKQLFEEHKNNVILPNSFKNNDIQKYKENIKSINNKENVKIKELKKNVLSKISNIEKIQIEIIKIIYMMVFNNKKVNNKNKIKFIINEKENNNINS